MANRCTLHKTKLEEFKTFLDSEGIAHRKGKGDYQALQVKTDKHGWQCVYEKNDMPEHYSVQDKLMPTVKAFIRSQIAEIKKEDEIEEELRRSVADPCKYCSDEPKVIESGNASSTEWYVECECGCRGPGGLEPDAIEGWNLIMGG